MKAITETPAAGRDGRRASAVCREAGAAGLLALTLYLVTLQQDVSLPDSAVIMEAMQGPVISAFACNHTLNNLVGWLVCRLLPVGTLAWRCHAVSAVAGACVVGLFHALVRHRGASRTLAALCTATLAVSHGLWWHATVVENYALSAVLFLACATLLTDVDGGAQRPGRSFALFFLAGLSLLNHLQNGLLLAGCAAAYGGQWRRHGRAAVAGATLGLAPLLAVAGWELATGRAGDAPLAWFLGGGGFGAAMFRHVADGGLGAWVRLLLWHHPGPFAVAVVAGLLWAWPRRTGTFRPLDRLVWVVVAGNSLFFLGYATWDRFSFFLSVWVAAAVAAAGWLAACERRGPRRVRVAAIYLPLALGVVFAPGFYVRQARHLAATGHESWLTRGYAQVVRDYRNRYDLAGMLLDPVQRDRGTIASFIRQAMAALPPGSVWVDDGSTYDQVIWMQRREGLRPDIEALLLVHPLLPQRGAASHALAMRVQWERARRRWFVVTDEGPAAELIAHLRPFGWRTRPLTVAPGRSMVELERGIE